MTGQSTKPDDKRKTRKLPPHLWKKGQSGNPAGKPKGCGRLAWFNNLIKDRKEDIVNSIVERARAGNEKAMELVMSRMIPMFQPMDEIVEVEGYEKASTRMEKAKIINNSVAAGLITPNQGVVMMVILEKSAKIQEVDDLMKRIEDVEKKIGKKND